MQGFNAVRLPFLFKDLKAKPMPKATYCQSVDAAYLKKRVTDPQLAASAATKPLPKPAVAMPQVGGSKLCNSYFPSEWIREERWAWQHTCVRAIEVHGAVAWQHACMRACVRAFGAQIEVHGPVAMRMMEGCGCSI